MTPGLALFANLRPPPLPPDIDLRCADVRDVLAAARGSRLVFADPPWRYARDVGGANPEQNGIYNGLTEQDIVAHLDAAYDCAAAGSRLVCWYTWPKLAEWVAAGLAGPRWGGIVSGGAWTKHPHVGVGYHWRGMTEPVAIFTKGATGRPNDSMLRNGYVSRPEGHSEKPEEWTRQMIRAWTDPGDLVLDLYAGLGVVARACKIEGRRYIGAEIDPERHAAAVARLAQVPA